MLLGEAFPEELQRESKVSLRQVENYLKSKEIRHQFKKYKARLKKDGRWKDKTAEREY